MLQDKRADLDGEKQKALLMRLISALSAERPDLYYQPTAEVARQVLDYARDQADLGQEDRALLKRLSNRDVEVLLSLH